MLVPSDVLTVQSNMSYQLNKYYSEQVQSQMKNIEATIHEMCKITQDILKVVEVQEHRFISSLSDFNGRYDGINITSPNEFEIILYLNQKRAFNFIDDPVVPGCAQFKLSDGRKRSVSLWEEFITTFGCLSARKIRSRFQELVTQACKESIYRDTIKVIPDTTEVKLRIHDQYTIQITPAFKCEGTWPRQAAQWPLANVQWPPSRLVAEVKTDGFDLLSKECPSLRGESELLGNTWVLSFVKAEDRLLQGASRRKCLAILKTLRDRHLDLPDNPVSSHHIKTLLLYECEKHPREIEWDDTSLGDRINGIFLQLILCLQCRRCPHYFLPNVDLFCGKSPSALENAAKQVWRLSRDLLTNPRSLETL